MRISSSQQFQQGIDAILRQQAKLTKTQEQLAQEKKTASYKLFKLDIISNIERLELETETKQAQARIPTPFHQASQEHSEGRRESQRVKIEVRSTLCSLGQNTKKATRHCQMALQFMLEIAL